MKPQTFFICSKCGAQYPKWTGRCTECGNWGTVGEEHASTPSAVRPRVSQKNVHNLSEVKITQTTRLTTGLNEFDRVLGGGIVPGSFILIGGEPGIGKSTLILQIAEGLKKKVLYISGEESESQIKMRLDRLNLPGKNIRFLSETHLETLEAAIALEKPDLAIIDSIQTVYSDAVPSEPGSVAQVRTCAVKLMETAKHQKIAILVIGHITKEGTVAGPKTLEHLVDTVVYFEGERYQSYRLLRTVKNRFGSTNEIGVFEMTGTGLQEIKNPAAVFLMPQRSHLPGTVIAPILEGTRVFMAEIQALVSKTPFGYPQRKTVGFDSNRLNLLPAVLQKRAGMALDQYDIHVNIAGGLKVNEPALDLAVAMAIASAFTDKSCDPKTVVFGEIGLGGELRPVQQSDKRLSESEKLGFKIALVPTGTPKQTTKITLQPHTTLTEALSQFKD